MSDQIIGTSGRENGHATPGTIGDKSAASGRQRIKLNPRAEQIAGQFALNPISPAVLANFLRLVDFISVFSTGAVIFLFYVMPIDGVRADYFAIVTVSAIATIVSIQSVDGYQVQALGRHLSQIGRVFGAWTTVFALLAVAAFFAQISAEYSRVWFGLWYLGGVLYFLLSRSIIGARVRHWSKVGRLERRAVLIGGGEQAEELLLSLEAQPENDIRICGIFDDRSDERSPPMVAGYPKIGTIPELVEFGRRARIDMLIVSLPMSAERRVLDLLKKVWVLPVDIRLSAQSNQLRFRPRAYSYVGSVPFLDVFDKPIADWDSVLKRCFDVCFSLIALVLFSPVMLVTALAVKLTSKGPVFFRQKRFGFNNEPIDVLKFRSMRAEESDPDARKVVTRDDPRVTPVGRFIRRTSIDELPQLFNVLSGELSLVGPRPHAVNAHTHDRLWDEVVEGYFGRHKVKPGVTGWAQINGWRGEVDSEEKLRRRVEHDLYYIENWSVLFDLYICLMTPLVVLKQENAY